MISVSPSLTQVCKIYQKLSVEQEYLPKSIHSPESL